MDSQQGRNQSHGRGTGPSRFPVGEELIPAGFPIGEEPIPVDSQWERSQSQWLPSRGGTNPSRFPMGEEPVPVNSLWERN